MSKGKLTRFDELIIKDFTFNPRSHLAKSIVDEVKDLENMRMNQYILLENELEYYNILDRNMVPNALDIAKLYKDALKLPMSISFENKALKIVINDFLPSLYLKTSSRAAGYFAERWRTNIGIQLNNFCKENKLFYDKVFVLVKSYVPFINDFDNKFYKPIFDGLVNSKLIINDDCDILKYGIKTELETENPKTEIYIYGDENIPKFI